MSIAASNAGLGPETIVRYLQGAPPEMEQYAFFIGAWSCDVRAFPPDGSEPLALKGEWRAEWIHGGRMLYDDLSISLPSGEEIVGWVNLRTWSADSSCWVIGSQRALSPASGVITHGHWRDGEMQLEFTTEVDGAPLTHLVRFHAITPDSFEWVWQNRTTSERPWNTFASISARRA